MSLICEHCAIPFPSNAKLYMHKKAAHSNPSLVLVNHDHPSSTNDARKRKLVSPDGKNSPTPGSSSDPQLDPNLVVVDEYDAKRPKKDDQLDDGLKVIDDESEDDEKDPGLTVVDEWTRRKDYRQLYKKCLREGKDMKIKFDREKDRLASGHKAEMIAKLEEQKGEFEKKMLNLKQRHDKQLADLEDVKEALFNDKMKQKDKELADMRDMCEAESKQLKTINSRLLEEVNDAAERHKAELVDLEKQCQDKIAKLNALIKSLQEDDADLNPLIKSIYNCVTMEEIFKIQRLVKNHQWDLLVQDHLPALQNLFLSLSYGIIPICQPQRDKITNDQRDLVEKIQSSSKPAAKRILLSKRDTVANLFSIIKDSIKLARNSYNRYAA
jgi:hypothetical protein